MAMRFRWYLHGAVVMAERLNKEFLEELKDIMDEEFPLLLQTYLRESERQLQGIDQAWQAGELDDLRRSAHSLKGSSGNIGAEALAELCAELERSAKHADVTAVPETLEALSGEFVAVKEAVTRIHQGHS